MKFSSEKKSRDGIKSMRLRKQKMHFVRTDKLAKKKLKQTDTEVRAGVKRNENNHQPAH